MDQKIYDRMVSFRRQIHQYPQIGFQEFQTRDRIKKILFQFGIQENQMFDTQPTALHVDIYGKGAPSGKPRCVAFRADMDALTMTQTNHGLQYISKNHGKAHMCGHDGHMACLTAFVPLFLKKLDQVPSDRRVRLLYQPSQEGPGSGADQMVKKGCIDEVDEVYGFHQWPTAPLGQLWCKDGVVMSQPTVLEIKIIGTSGHGSEPEKCKQATRAGVRFYTRAMDYIDTLMSQKKNAFVCTLPVFKSGQRFNVISQCCIIQGSIRSFEKGLNKIIIAKFRQFLEDLVKEGFKYQLKDQQYFPMNVNTKQESEHVLRIGKKVFGQQNANEGQLPFRASQDFSFFTLKKPGAYFFLSTAQGQNSPMVHCSNFNFNDKLIPKAAQFWLQLALDRLK